VSIKNSKLLLLTFFTFFALGVYSQTAPKKKMDPNQLKALFVYKFTNYVLWPNESDMKEFVICVMSSDALHYQLNGISNLAKFRDKIPIKVINCKSINDIRPCQMIVVDGTKNINLNTIYSKIKGKSVLMIAEKLYDFKKSMISFVETDGHVKYIIYKQKIQESNLVIKDKLYAAAIVKEDDWKSIVDKFKSLANSDSSEVKVNKADINKILGEYKSLEEEKSAKETLIKSMEDTLLAKSQILDAKMAEYDQVTVRIKEQKQEMELLDEEMKVKSAQIKDSEGIISKQESVITIIAVLSALGVILLLFSFRSNNQRRKANKLLSQQKALVEKQKQLVDEKQKEILDSINYAKRIQTALMANSKMMHDNLSDHFVYFKPKDIVAGDFYWAARLPDSFIYITADSTGHGVPGAFMSLLNISKLNDAINNNITRPDLVLNEVKSGIIRALNPEGSSEVSKDGMDAILCRIDIHNMKLQYAAANNSFCIIRDKTIITCKADKMPVGKSHDDASLFTYNEFALQKGDMIYTFTDGYGDQFGGPEGKKFMHKQLRSILLKIAELPLSEQNAIINQRFEAWKGNLEQVDDVLVIGVRV
jgi:serine phosphatase RsbU (regulator of sigma subunit)